MNLIKGIPPKVKPGTKVALDIELFGADRTKLHRPTGTFACLSVAIGDDVYQVYDLADMRKVLQKVAPGEWMFHNAAFDIFHLRRWTRIDQRKIWDTILMEKVLFGGYYEYFALEDLARRWLKVMVDKSLQKAFETATMMSPQMENYAAMDAHLTLKIANAQADYIRDQDRDVRAYWEIDEPALWSIFDMPPVPVNKDGWLDFVKTFDPLIVQMETELGLNAVSPKQVSARLASLSGKRIRSTEESELVWLRDNCNEKTVEFIDKLLIARRLRTAKSRYGASWIEKHVENGNLVYPRWNVIGTETGRMSCSDPNLQQIPVRTMPEYRTFFPSSYENGRIIILDVSQQEPRITAWLSRDKRLLADVTAGDVYLPIARTIYQDPTITRADKKKRDRAKGVFLGVTYGLTPAGLARREGLDEMEAAMFFDSFSKTYIEVTQWMRIQRSRARAAGWVETPYRRRVWINPHNYQWENNALNGPVQGGAADMTKIAMVLIHERVRQLGIPFCVSLLVHDEMVLDVPHDVRDEYVKLLPEVWSEAGQRVIPGVPVKVDMSIGKTWGDKT